MLHLSGGVSNKTVRIVRPNDSIWFAKTGGPFNDGPPVFIL